MAERPLYTLYKNLKAQNYDVPDDYNKFENALTRDGKGGADNRHAIYENLKAQNFDVPDTYERFYSALFEPRSKTSSRAKGGSVPMSAADRARFLAGAAAISESAKQMANNTGRYNRLKQRKQKQQKDFGRVSLGTHMTPFGGDANNVVKDDFAYNPETGKVGAYVTSDNENAYTQSDAEQKQAILDKYGEEWNKAVDMGMVPSELDKADPDMSDTDVAMRQMERRQKWLDENQNRRSKELNESMHLQDSPFVASGGAVAPSSFNTSIGNEANRLSDVEYGAYNTAKAYNQMLRTNLLQQLKEQKQRGENAGWWKDKWNDVSNYFSGMLDTMFDPKLFSQGVMDAAMANNMLQVKKGMEDGTIKKGSNAGNAAQAMFGAIQQQQGEAAKQQQNGAKAYQYGDMNGRSLKFMADFLTSGWRNVMTTGFTKAGEEVGAKMALGELGKWFTKNTGRVLGDMAGSAALAATNQLGSTYNNVIERYVGMNNENGGVTQDKDGDLSFNKGVSLGKAIKDGFGSATIENFSEMFGEYLPGASKLLSKLGLSKVSSFFEKIGNNAYYRWLSNATNKSGIQGVMAEISEEEFGTALHAAWGDGDGSWSDFNVFTNPDAREKQIDTCLGMFYSVGFMQAPRTAVGAINAVQYYKLKHQVNKADKFGQGVFNDNWDEIKSKIDVSTNADLTKTVLDATRSDSMTAKQKDAVINYAMFLSKLRGFNQASDAKTKDKVEEGETVPTLSNYLDDAYTEGHNADDADKHDIQIQHEDQSKTLAAALGISEQQLSAMSDEELESLTGQDDKLDQAIYDYQLSTARYQGVVDDAQDKVDLAAHQAEQRVNMYTDRSRGSVRNATIKASGGAEDYGVYIISGNIATHDDGSIDVGNSDDMILYYDPTTNSVEHADALMFAELGEELPADDVKAQTVADAKENAIKEVAGIIDGTVEVGSQFSVTDADGTEHTYEVLADNGDGTAMITIDGNVPTELVNGENVQIPYSFEDLQQMKDLEDQKRLEAAKAEREQMEKERDGQETEQTEESQPSFDFNQILNDNGNVVLVDVLGKDGNTKYPGSKLFLIRDAGAKAKVVELKNDGTLVPHAVNKEDVATISTMTLDEYKQAMPSSMIEENSGEIEVETPTIEGETAGSAEETAAPEATETPETEQTPATPAITLEDGTIVPMLEDGNPDFSKLTAAQTAELYDNQFGEDADSIVSGYVSDAKKALDKANNMTVKGKTFVEQKASKDAKEKAIADAQAAYDSAIAIRDAYNERQLAKEENTPEGRKSLIEKAKRKYARLKNSEEWSERPGDLWNETVGKLLHRLYDATGIDVFNDTPNTVYEYVAANVGPYSLNYEGNDNSKGVQQETGLSRSDFAKLGWLAAEGKGMTIDAKVHRLWENRPSNLESADTQEIRNALISLITSGQTAFQARDYILNQRIELAESALEEQLRQEEDAAEAQRAKEEEEKKKAEQEKKAEEESKKAEEEKVEEEKTEDNENTEFSDNSKEESKTVEVPEDATDDAPLGEQLDESDLPFSAKENGTQQTPSERAADVEKNKVDDMKVVDNIVGQKTRKAFERLAKMMGANIQWQYSDKMGNGWIQETKDADGNVHRTIFITLDSSITEGAQFIFGHEMTHQIKNLNPAAYNELTQLVLDTYGSDAFDKAVDETMKRYSDAGFSGRARDYYAEEVVADSVGEMIRDLNLAHTLAMKMSHPLLAAIHEILQKIKLAFFGTEYSDVTKNIIRSIEQAYVKTAKGRVENSETGEDVSFSLRLKSAIEETETNPSDAQKESGNYKKGHIKFGGYDYTIENPKGSTRSGKDADGKEWKVTMHDTYGYIRGKFGKDGDHLDMFINDKADLDNWNGDVFVVDQVNPDGSFDEHKVMYGYDSMDDAEKAYLANYSKGWQGLGNITGASKAEFDKWLDTSNRKIKPFADYAKVKFSQAQSVDNEEPKTFEEFLNHPSLKFSIKNEEQRKAAEDAYEYAAKLRPNKYAQYAIVDMSKPSKIPEYYEKKVLADNWRRFYNRAVHNELNDVRKKAWGNYKLFDLDRPFADQVNEVKGNVPDEFDAPDAATNKDNSKGLDRQMSSVAETRYSLKDEKTLAGVHNITEEKLRKALKLGGFANPSLAVIDTNKNGHDNFGEISFIAPSALLDKRTGKTAGTWITDAYTQRYPSVERQMSEKGSQKFRDWVDSLEYPAADKAEIKRQAEEALSNNNAPAWELMYLKEKGIDIKEYNSKVDYRWKEIIRDHPTAEDILSSMQNDPELNEKVTSLVKHTIIHPTWEKVSLEVRRKIYEETGNKVSPINPQVRKQTKEIFERDYAPTLLDKDGKPKAEDIKKVVEDIVKEHNDTKKYDFYLSKVKASNYVNKNGLYDDYIRWQENKLDEFGTKNRIFRGYTKDGSRKYVPETLENVSKAMREEADGQTNGSEYTSFGSFIAKLASRVDSTDEMRANKDKLSSNKDKEEFYEKWNGVYYDLAKFLCNDVFYGEQRLHDIVLQSDPKKYAKKEYGITLTPTFMKKLDALKNAVQTELKSAYFETKYNRPLRLNEFAAAVVPDNLGEDVRKGIEDAGLPMYNYDPNKEGDRNRAFNEAVNSSDNIRFSLKEEKEKIVADAKANGTYMTAPNGEKTKLDAEQWATVRTTNFKNWFGDWENDPENASKVVDENGEPMVMYHYTDENFTIFGKDKEVGKNTFGNATNASYAATTTIGHWFTSNKNQPEYMGKPMECFLNIVEPFDGYTLEGLADYLNNYISDEDFNSYEEDYENVAPIIEAGNNFREEKIKDGYDGVVIDDEEFGGTSYVAFNANQIKSAENNNGDFSADNNDIRFSLKSMMAKPEGWKQANKKAIHIAEAIERDPKFSLKNLDGTLIKAGTYFSGGGLVEEGLKGIIDPVVAVEYDEKISGVYRNNFGQHIVTADVRDVDPKELVKHIDGEVEYFHASPVCKNYSQAKSNHAEVELDKETAASTAEFINAIKPKVVTIENVKGYKDSEAMKTITDALDANGYTWDADVYNAADYGGYTNRERLIVRAVRDGKLPDKPKKMAHKSGWYEAVEDIIPTLTEKKNGVASWMDIRLKADGIDWRNIDKPLYVMGSAYADGKIPHAFADELLPTLRTKSGDVIVMPDGKVYRAMGRVLARVSGVSDDYKMPFSENLSHTIIGNGIPTQLTEHVIAPLLTGSDPKFSIRTYHGTGAKFDKFDFSHMGEGEGSQAFGWGGYVTNSKDIAEDYTRRAKIRKDNGGFEFVTDMSANNKDMVRQYIYKHKDVNKGLDAMRKDLSSAIEMFPDDDDLKELSNILAKKNEEIAVPDNIAYLYDVDIPDDNGDYLDWDAPLTDKQKNTIIKELRRLKIDFADFKKRGFSFDGSFGDNAYGFLMYALRKTKKWKDVDASRAVSKFLSSIGFTGIKYKAGTIFGGAKEGDTNYVIFDENNAKIVGNTRFSLRYDKFEHDLNQWKKDNNLPKDAKRPTIPQRNVGESAVDFLRRVDEYRKQMALWKTAPTYEQHLLSDDTALGEFNRELQRGSVLKRIAFQDSMLAIRKAQEAIMKEVGVDRLNMAEDAYTAENRSHGKGKNEFEEYNNEFLQPLRKAYHQMKKVLGDSYDNVRLYMMAKHGLERNAQMAFKESLEADYEDVAQRSAAYKAYKGDISRMGNDSGFELGLIDYATWVREDNAIKMKYSPSYMKYRYDKMGIAFDYSGLSALFDGSDFEEAAHKLVRDIESKHIVETKELWDATNAATKKILRDGYKAGMMSKDTYQYVRDMYSHYIPLRGWDGTTADQVWDYIGGGKGAFNQTLKTAHGRTSIADDPIAYIENMAESGILLNNKNWVKQHLMLLAQNHPTSLLTLSKAWYVKSTDANGNEEWIPATPQITSQMNSNQVKAAIDAFEQKMEQMAQTGDATQQRDGLNIAFPQTHSEEREHEVRVMKDGEEYVIYVNGDPQLAQAMNNTRAHRVREIQSGKLDRAAAWLGRKMAAAYTSLSPLFIPSNYFRDLTMTLASTAIREDGRYNYLLRKNLATSWNLGFMLRDYQNGKLREKVNNGNATPKEQMFYDFMMNGGETGFVSSLDVDDLKKKFKNDLKDLNRWKANPVKVAHTIMDSIEFLNRAIEDSNRFAIYMTSIQYGRSIDEAVNDAKDVTLNFNRKGTGEYGWQMIRNLYLFINPAVQSLQTLGALAKHHPFKFTAVTASWLASGVLVPIVNAALMSLFGGGDDKDKYWQFTKWDRRNNLIMWVPFTHEYVKIPLAQEFRAFYGVGDMIASKMMGGELAEESWNQYAEDLLGQVVDMLPLDPTGYDGNIAVSLMPNPIRPIFELAFNVDFTGKPLFKDTEYNKYDPNFTKAYVGTPDWLVRASRMMNSIGNDYPDVQQNAIDAFGDPRYNLNNPGVVDHVLSSYLGGAYTMGSQVLGLLTKSLNDPKEIKVADIPLFSKFVSNPDDRPASKKQGDEFWDMKENHNRAANTLSKLKKQAKVDGDYSMLERFYGSEEYKQYKKDDAKVKKYEEDKKKERSEESGEEYRPHKLNAEDIYKAHATPKDDFEDLKLKQLYTKLNGFKSAYDLLVDTAPGQSEGYYNTNKTAIDAIDEVALDKQEISELKKGFLEDGKDAYNAEDMKQIRELRKKVLAVLEKANKVVVAKQKAKKK